MLLLAVLFLFYNVCTCCYYNVPNYGSVDFSPLSSYELTISKDGSSDNLLWTPCKNEAECLYNDDQDTDNGMANQMRSSGACNGIVAKNNCNSAKASYQMNDNNQDTVIITCPDIENVYSTSSNTARRLQVTYICDETATPYANARYWEDGKDESNPPNRVPLYFVEISTIYACKGQSAPLLSDNSLTGGSIFLIIFVSVFAAYCIFGYMFSAIKSKEWKNAAENVPNAQFWVKLPRLVQTGCIVSYEYFKSIASRKSP